MGNSNSTALTTPTNSTGFNFQLFTNLFNFPHAAATVAIAEERPECFCANDCPQVDRTTTIVIPTKGTHTATAINPLDAPQLPNPIEPRQVEAAGKPVPSLVAVEMPETQTQTEEMSGMVNISPMCNYRLILVP